MNWFYLRVCGETTEEEFRFVAVDLQDAMRFATDYVNRRYPSNGPKCLYWARVGEVTQ